MTAVDEGDEGMATSCCDTRELPRLEAVEIDGHDAGKEEPLRKRSTPRSVLAYPGKGSGSGSGSGRQASLRRRLGSAWARNWGSVWRRSPKTHSISRSFVLDGLRALAVLWVIAFHVMVMVVTDGLSPLVSRLVSFWPAQIAFNGDMGVDVFFTLSGYLIGRILLKEMVAGFQRGVRGTLASLCTFYVRRWLRIFPMLVTAIVLTIAANEISLAVNGGKNFSQFDFVSGNKCTDFGEVWPMLLFVNNYVGDFQCLVQTWSVAVEVQMYLVSPLIIWLVFSFKARRPRRFCYAALFFLSGINIATNAYMLYVTQKGELFHFIPQTKVDGNGILPLSYVATWTRYSPYVSGVTVSLMQWEEVEIRLPRAALCTLDVLTLLVLGSLLFLGAGTNYLTYQTSPALAQVLALGGRWIFGWGIAYFIFMCNRGRLRAFNAILSVSFWYPIAVLSYGAYLLHLIWTTFVKGVDDFRAISPLKSIWVSWSVFNWDFTVCVLFSFLSALITYLLVEKPLMNVRPTVRFASQPAA
ncbi:putative acyltransferase [Chloropicon primus]|uniref:Putative acyltransferase n=1 Tax=Chloropicon primus TaxID=1764295 RepID=A0A5B8MBS2_9CHLO|nr:putative acyltransferase [Chloropicon primus]|eukprot:QDZ17813.1 putative acyltransferase [Chloropicon primus]